MRLRMVLGQLVAITLANQGCTPRHTGGGCPPHDVTREIGADADDTLKALVAACTGTAETCDPVCKELFDRQHENGAGVRQCKVDKHGETATVTYMWMNFCAGRRPDARSPCARIATVRDWLRAQGRLEAASVIAFEQLAQDLIAHDAPQRLARACRRAAADERRHARLCGTVARPARVRRSTPALEALAIDNAVEGEVRETWGAVAAAWQAQTARSPVIRAAMRSIAPDELRHAELAAQLGRFYASRLPPAARARVARAKIRAIAELVRDPIPTPLADELGLPPAALLEGLRRSSAWQ